MMHVNISSWDPFRILHSLVGVEGMALPTRQTPLPAVDCLKAAVLAKSSASLPEGPIMSDP